MEKDGGVIAHWRSAREVPASLRAVTSRPAEPGRYTHPKPGLLGDASASTRRTRTCLSASQGTPGAVLHAANINTQLDPTLTAGSSDLLRLAQSLQDDFSALRARWAAGARELDPTSTVEPAVSDTTNAVSSTAARAPFPQSPAVRTRTKRARLQQRQQQKRKVHEERASTDAAEGRESPALDGDDGRVENEQSNEGVQCAKDGSRRDGRAKRMVEKAKDTFRAQLSDKTPVGHNEYRKSWLGQASQSKRPAALTLNAKGSSRDRENKAELKGIIYEQHARILNDAALVVVWADPVIVRLEIEEVEEDEREVKEDADDELTDVQPSTGPAHDSVSASSSPFPDVLVRSGPSRGKERQHQSIYCVALVLIHELDPTSSRLEESDVRRFPAKGRGNDSIHAKPCADDVGCGALNAVTVQNDLRRPARVCTARRRDADFSGLDMKIVFIGMCTRDLDRLDGDLHHASRASLFGA
ncbi:hypothetical protein DFH11DRAFT_1548469 [Phellopilus nigrolimitatus]|nr:hypothetical protein DFH11DRAFT_1548469 [Phellopilus nigrolimitatus]